MKKFYLLGCLALMAVSGSFAQTSSKPDNKAFYLVGDFNGWQLPTTDPDNFPYRVTDEDGDGEYTASFNIPESGLISFKVFSEPSEWEPGTFWGCNGRICVFNEWMGVMLDEGMNSDNITIPNWKGGTLEIRLKWKSYDEQIWMPAIYLKGNDQPDKPIAQDIYYIGDFNDWKLPSLSSDNGALALENLVYYTESYFLSCYPEFDKGNLQLAICGIDKETGKVSIFDPHNNIPITLYSIETSNDTPTSSDYSFTGSWKEGIDPKNAAITINDWQGGKMYSYVRVYYTSLGEALVSFWTLETPAIPKPNELYYIYDNGEERILQSCDYFIDEYSGYFYIWTTTQKGEATIILTSENSLYPDQANCWGIEGTLADLGMDKQNPYKTVRLVKGGQPFKYDFPYGGKITVDFAFSNSVANVSLEFFGGPIVSDKVYICGDISKDEVMNGFTAPNAANQTFYDEYFSLEKVGEGLFEGVYYVPVKDTSYSFPDNLSQFRFFTGLYGWTNTGSLGSAPADFYCLPVDLTDGAVELPIVEKGLGNWGPCMGDTWPGGYLKVIVNLNEPSVKFQRVESGIEEIESLEPGVEKWLNLQGLPVEKPENGMYIHIVDGKSRVERVK